MIAFSLVSLTVWLGQTTRAGEEAKEFDLWSIKVETLQWDVQPSNQRAVRPAPRANEPRWEDNAEVAGVDVKVNIFPDGSWNPSAANWMAVCPALQLNHTHMFRWKASSLLVSCKNAEGVFLKDCPPSASVSSS